MRPSRKILVLLGALVLLLIALPLAIAFAFGGRVSSALKAQVNRSLTARVDWDRAGLSVFRDFPDVGLSLGNLSIIGREPFEGDTLAFAREARLVLDLPNVIRHLRTGERIVVRELALRQPVVNLRVLEDGRANWQITRDREAATSDTAAGAGLSLRELQVSDGRLSLDNARSRLVASLRGIQWAMNGDFARDSFTLSTRTRADTVSFRFAGIPWLTRVGMEFNADIDADTRAGRYTFRDDTLRLNALLIAFTGSVTAGDPDVQLDVAFAAPSTAFREILSLVPAIYSRDFESLRTTGTMSVSGQVRGVYGPDAFPQLALKARVAGGAFQYPGMPLPARGITMDLAVDNPGGKIDNTVLDLKRFHAAIGDRPIDGRLVVRTPVSDPDLDLRLKGSLDLADVARTVKLEDVRELAGLIAADVAMRARVSDFDAGRYDRVAASGTVNGSKVALRSETIARSIAIDTLALRLTPRSAELVSFASRIGNSDVRATGSLDNLLGFLLRDDELRGRATVASNHFDLNEWRSEDETTEVIPVPARVDFALNASAARVSYGTLNPTNVRGGLRIKDERVTLDDLRMDLLRGAVVANGFYETRVASRPTFDMDLRLTSVDIPTAFTSLNTVQKLAPIARWAQGTVSGAMKMTGAVATDMTPVLSALTGKGTVETGQLVLQGAPILHKLGDALSLDQLRNPALSAFQASITVADGRLHVSPFTVRMNDIDVMVAGSNGIDQSLAYDLRLAVPRASLGSAANRTVERLASEAGKAGVDLAAGEVVQLSARVGGTVTNPSVNANFAGMAASAREAAADAARQAVATRAEDVRERVDSAADQARRRAQAEAARLVDEAERRAATVRAEARILAETIRREAHQRADSLLARATNPAARIAAQAATDRLKREANQRADQVVREADARADGVVASARRQAEALAPPQP